MRKNLPSPTSATAAASVCRAAIRRGAHWNRGRRALVLVLSGALIVAGSVLTAPVSAAAEPADDEEVTRVEELTAVVDGDQVLVNGRATFVDVPATVGESPVGFTGGANSLTGPVDPAVGGAVGEGDLDTVTIARPDPFADNLAFTIRLHNPPAEAQELRPVTYRWTISLLGAPLVDPPATPLNYQLEAARSGHLVHPGSLDPTFRLIRGRDGGCDLVGVPLDCRTTEYDLGMRTLADLEGSVTADTIQWQLPFGLIEAEQGSTISTFDGRGVASYMGLLGGRQRPVDHLKGETEVSGGQLSERGSEVARYTIPEPTVQFGIAPAGTPVGEIALTADANVESPGAFAASVTTPQEPGDYIVAARACYGDNNCDTATTNVTVV